MRADYEKEICYFVGGNGNKTGVPVAGGCTVAWLAAQNGDPSALFGADGGCLYSNTSIEIGMDSRITGAAGTFAGVQVGMVAYIDAMDFDSGYYEVTAVGANEEYVEFAGADEIFYPQNIGVTIGGAFDSLGTAYFHTSAYNRSCYILSNKDETLTGTALLNYAGGVPYRNTTKNTIGYGTNVFVENERIVSDMDPGKGAYQSVLDVFQNGVTAGKKVVLDGSGLSAMAVSWRADNFVMRNFHIKANTGYACMQPDGGTALQYKGAAFINCIFDGGTDGIKSNGVADFVVCRDCIALNASGAGFNLLDAGNRASSSECCGCIAADCGTGLAVSGGGIVNKCLAEDCTTGVETSGAAEVKNCVLYNCLEAGFGCSAATARCSIFNTIVVLNENAAGVFQVGSDGGSVVYEDYNCFIDRLGSSVTLHDNSNWPWGYDTPLIGLHTLQTSPQFVNVTGKDFTLQDDSPCVNAGRPDLYGNRSHIGLYETPEAESGGEGENNVQVNVNVQYGPRNVQYS